ncbi:MAG: phosphoribosylamine--glycine ligase [Sphaerochaetaceae bacterium]
MDILVVGGGGRESAIVAALKRSSGVGRVYCAPGNGGIPDSLSVDAMDFPGLLAAAKEKRVGFVVVGPDDPLAAGLVDLMEANGFPCFGPDAKAALIEASKAFAKDLMRRHGVPTASYRVFSDIVSANSFVESCPLPVVVKADGLALGKGVVVAATRNDAKEALRDAMADHAFGKSGNTVVVEEFLTGPEVSVLSFTDGKTIVPMVSSMDHKRAFDGDRGPNTGGMGAVAPNPWYTPEIAKECMERIFRPTVDAMRSEGRPFKGCLYFGLMLTREGPKVIEYNCRFGDPEAEAVLPLLESDLLTIMRHVRDGCLEESDVCFRDASSCCIVLASGGYPLAYEKGKRIFIGHPDAVVYHAGTAIRDGLLVTNGGRVLDVVSVAPTLREAIGRAYGAVDEISFEKMYMRRDIGRRALTGA